MERPNLKGIDPQVVDYIQCLEKIIDGYSGNGAVDLVSALNNQLRMLADQIQVIDIDITKSDDKTFERFVQLVKLVPDATKDFKALLQEYGDVIKIDDKKAVPFIEQLLKRGK